MTGSITGTVTDSETGRPLAGAQVVVAGSVRSTVSNASGEYVMNFSAGGVTLECSTLGYARQQRTTTVREGQVTTENFALAPNNPLSGR